MNCIEDKPAKQVGSRSQLSLGISTRRFRWLKAALAALFMMGAATTSIAQNAGTVSGALCKGLAFITKHGKDVKTLGPTAADATAVQDPVLHAYASRMAQSGMTPDEVDAKVNTQDLAAMMSDIHAQATAAVPDPQETSTAPTVTAPADSWSSFDIARTTLSVAGMADPTGATAVVAAYLYPKCSTKEAQSGKGTFCWKDSNVRGVGLVPTGCDPQHPDLQVGLCYQSCPSGMVGKGPVCWTTSKVSTPRGAGLVPKSCASDHPDEQAGLCYQSCPDGYHGIGPVCWKGISSHARGVGIPPNGCDPAHPDMNVGLCYSACPAGQSGDGPVCWTNQPISHPRGAGVVPTGCPADHPNLDAGLCYQTCQSGKGVGPVCWATCQGKFAEACGAGCATNKVECGFATSDMVSTPLEMVGNIVSLGTASGETAAARDAEAATKAEAEKVAKTLAEDAAKRELEDASVEAALKAEKTGAQLKKDYRLGKIDYLEYLANRGESEGEVQKAMDALESFNKKDVSVFQKVKDRANAEIAILKGQGGDQLVAKFKSLTPTRNLANKLEDAAGETAFYKKLKAVADLDAVKRVKQGEAVIAGCSKLGLAISKQALGLN